MANKYQMRRRALRDTAGRGEGAGRTARGDKRGEREPSGDYTPPPRLDRLGLTAALCLGLVVLVSLLYVQTAGHDFTVCDDNVYVYDKPQIVSGVTWENVKWAFGDAHEGNWHPLTWISHMLDWQLFSEGSWQPENLKYGYSWPGGHHLVGMAIHCANVVLLFLALRLMTGTLWPSLVVAVLFAAHPLRAESVAWAAERKDVLCGLFWMATLLTYALYARRPPLAQSTSGEAIGTILLYLLVNVFMGLGLMAKSMIVTLPCILILLDIWPLGRWKKVIFPGGRTDGDIDILGGMLLLLEKVPLFAMAAADCYVTVYGQSKGVALNSFEGLPMRVRLLNAIESCGEYLRQTFWPTGLVPFYSHPHMIPHGWTHEFWEKFWIYSILLAIITLAAALFAFRRPYLAVGWLWYLGALMPVIGIIQVGTQARADRYTYLPMIGVYLMIAWLLKEVADRWPSSRPLLAAGGVVVLTAMCAASFQQVGYWRNSYVLFKHASGIKDDDYFGYTSDGKVDLAKASLVEQMADKTQDNYFAFNHIGIAYDKDGKELTRTNLAAAQEAFDRSAAAFAATLAIKPDYDFGNNNLGVYFARPGKSHDAVAAENYFRKAITVNQRYADAFNNLGIVLAEQGAALRAEHKFDEALGKLEDAARQHANGLAVRYDRASDHNNLCGVFLQMGQVHKDIADKAEAAGNTSKAAAERKLQDRALAAALKEDDTALECDRNFTGAWWRRFDILAEQGKPDEGVQFFDRIVEIDPTGDGPRALNRLVAYYQQKKEPEKALPSLDKAGVQFSQAIKGKPVSVEFIQMPFVLATGYGILQKNDKAAQWLDEGGKYIQLTMGDKPTSPDAAKTWLQIAGMYLQFKQPDKAISWLNQLVAAGQSPPIVLHALGNAYEMKGDLTRAKAYYEQALKLAPQAPEIQESLRRVNEKLGKPK
jgi:tetratricopeptide (TPR) repeat protein